MKAGLRGRGVAIQPFKSLTKIVGVMIPGILHPTGDPVMTQTPSQPLFLPASHEEAGIFLTREDTSSLSIEYDVAGADSERE